MTRATCKTCSYFWADGEAAGECHRFPPTGDHWVMLQPNDWCGEHPDFNRIDVKLRDVTTWDDEKLVTMQVGDDAA